MLFLYFQVIVSEGLNPLSDSYAPNQRKIKKIEFKIQVKFFVSSTQLLSKGRGNLN